MHEFADFVCKIGDDQRLFSVFFTTTNSCWINKVTENKFGIIAFVSKKLWQFLFIRQEGGEEEKE